MTTKSPFISSKWRSRTGLPSTRWRSSLPFLVVSRLLARFLALAPLLFCAAPFAAPAIPAISAPEIKTAKGFEVVQIYAVPRATAGSWVSLAAAPRGRLYTSDQYGPLHRITLPPEPGGAVVVAPLSLPIGGAHGLTWINDSLYAVVGQKTAAATGLHRLRDTNADGELDHVELLHALDGDGEHGPHAVVAAPDGKSLYVLAGNGTRLPELARSRVPRLWADDSLLAPLPALMGSETRGLLPGGWICRTDLDGRTWELHCAGFRNAYALAFDARGELFTFDSDTEFELNLPWYRPTRVLHALSGADFGWRRGALKVPDTAPDAWPSVLAMGLGSPTAVLSAPTAKFPAAYREALWVADWSYGKIFALKLQPAGASFTATREEIVSGLPLPVTAMCVHPLDGALYFTTGGRRLHSALYRLRWTGTPAAEPPIALSPVSPSSSVKTRRDLETFHGRGDAAAVDATWPALASDDAVLRRTARTALESQPVSSWRTRALEERAPRLALAALLALARADAAASQAGLLAALRRLHDARLDSTQRDEWLRVLALAFSRGGAPAPAIRAEWAKLLGPLFPSGNHARDTATLELLVYCEAPDAAAKGLAALRRGVTREAQLDFARSLRVLRTSWTPELRREFFDWFAQTLTWRGGGTFARFLQRLRDDALEAAPENERAALRELLAAAARKNSAPGGAPAAERAFVRAWTTDDLTQLARNDLRQRDAARGRALFGAAGCFACHVFDGEGGALGPDLSAVTRRMSVRDLFEAIVEPSREISDQYGTVEIRTRDDRRLSGRIVNLTDTGLHLAQNLADPANVVRLAENDIVALAPSKHSLMPAGLLNPFSDEEILDLLAFMRSGPPP
jgi:putative heme-binding domain-containing protein